MTTVINWAKALFPICCALCRKPSADWLCTECEALCPRIKPHCKTCARAMRHRGFCVHCLAKPRAFDELFVHWQYRDAVRPLILGAKYGASKAKILAISQGMQTELTQIPPVDALVPMAIAKRRLWQRGFNQSDLLARELAKTLNVPVESRLLLKKHRPPQSRLKTHAARRRNIKSAMYCIKAAPRRVLLIDDVVTSGASLNEAAIRLRAAGAETVYALTAAALQ